MPSAPAAKPPTTFDDSDATVSIEHFGGTRRYQLTDHGRRVAALFTKAHGRVLAPGLVQLDPTGPTTSPNEAPRPKPDANSTAPSYDYIKHQFIAA